MHSQLFSDRTSKSRELQLDKTPRKKVSGLRTRVGELTTVASKSLEQNIVWRRVPPGDFVLRATRQSFCGSVRVSYLIVWNYQKNVKCDIRCRRGDILTIRPDIRYEPLLCRG